MKTAALIFALAWLLAGCAETDRDYRATVTPERATVGVTLTPGTGRRSFTAEISTQ